MSAADAELAGRATVTGWTFKRAADVQVGDYAFLALNLPRRVLAVYPETAEGSRVSLVRFHIDNGGEPGLFVARLSHEFVVVEVRDAAEECTCEWLTRDTAEILGKSERVTVCPLHRRIFGMEPEPGRVT